jgi:phosphate transport system protein
MLARSPTNNDADLADLQQHLLRLAEAVDRAIVGATWALAHRDTDEAQRVVDGDAAIDELRYAIEQDAILLLAGQQLLADDARAISAVMLIAAELERMGDHAGGIATIVLRSAELPSLVVPPALGQMAHKAREMLQHAMRAVIQRDTEAAIRLERTDDTIDRLYQRVQWKHCRRCASIRNRANGPPTSSGSATTWSESQTVRSLSRSEPRSSPPAP